MRKRQSFFSLQILPIPKKVTLCIQILADLFYLPSSSISTYLAEKMPKNHLRNGRRKAG